MPTTTHYAFPTPVASDPADVPTDMAELANAIDSTLYAQLVAAAAAAVQQTLVDAKGDLLVGSAADVIARLAVGTNGQVLTADSAVAGGVKWATPAAGATSLYDRVTAALDIQNSAAETSLYSKVITANDLSTNKLLRLTLMGDLLKNNATGDTATLRVKFGGTTLIAAVLSSPQISANRMPWHYIVRLANLGATNSQYVSVDGAHPRYDTAAPTTGIGAGTLTTMLMGELGIGTLATIDTTANQTLDVTIQWSAASANNSWRRRYALLELI